MSKCYIDEMNASVRFWFVFFYIKNTHTMLLSFAVLLFNLNSAMWFFRFLSTFPLRSLFFALPILFFMHLIKLSDKYFHKEIYAHWKLLVQMISFFFLPIFISIYNRNEKIAACIWKDFSLSLSRSLLTVRKWFFCYCYYHGCCLCTNENEWTIFQLFTRW